MAKTTKYGLANLRKDFPTDRACIEFLFDAQHTRECTCGGTYHLMQNGEDRKVRSFQCSKCRFKISPTAGTIFHKSDTPLTLWFHALWVFSNAKSGISAKELERQLAVTYKTAWRMLTLIRKSLGQDKDKLKGDVEMDTGYFGGRYKSGRNNAKQSEAMKAKGVVMGAIQRGGQARLKVVPDATSATHGQFLAENIEPQGTRLMTDKTNLLNRVAVGYDRHSVYHHGQEFVRGDVHVNNVEALWSHIKRSITGTHKVVSKKHLQEYLDAFVWHRNNRHSDTERFYSLLGMILRGAR
jgi:transposase-like protein